MRLFAVISLSNLSSIEFKTCDQYSVRRLARAYYYFDDDSIVLLESMQDGVLYSNILLKLYLKSLKHGGRLQLDEDIPYTAQMIATITRQQIGTVERALQIFLKLGLVEVLDSGTFYMSNIELLIGQSSTEAERKRIYDAIYQEGTIFLLLFVNDATVDWTGQTTDHYYSLVVSEDGGENYYERSRIPIPSLHHGYGSMMFLEDGRLIVYNYNLDDEYNLSYVLSEDKGMSWGQAGTTFVAKKIRNPQVVGFEHLYFLHGRSGNNGEQAGNFVLYCSEDGIHWDEGRYLKVRTEGLGAYSNNLVIGKGTSHEKLLIQASHAYKDNQTNVLHWQIIKRKV